MFSNIYGGLSRCCTAVRRCGRCGLGPWCWSYTQMIFSNVFKHFCLISAEKWLKNYWNKRSGNHTLFIIFFRQQLSGSFGLLRSLDFLLQGSTNSTISLSNDNGVSRSFKKSYQKSLFCIFQVIRNYDRSMAVFEPFTVMDATWKNSPQLSKFSFRRWLYVQFLQLGS